METVVRKEEAANRLTHLFGLGLSIVGVSVLIPLAFSRGNPLQVASLSVFGSSLVLLYLVSTLYHTFQAPRLKSLFQVLDHISIYLLIAGTYTPFTLVSLRDGFGWTLCTVVWGMALVGVVFKILYRGRYPVLSTLTYLGMGWLAVVAVQPLLATIPLTGVIWLAAGGMSYTIGVVFFAWERLAYNHAIWHVFVLIGSLCHYFAALFYVLP